jgi:hypothetical protein
VSRRGATLARMIRVYADLDCGARCITFKSEQPPAPLELVRAFDDEEREAAWVLFHQLGHLFTRTSRPRARQRPAPGVQAQGTLASHTLVSVGEHSLAPGSEIDGRRHGS